MLKFEYPPKPETTTFTEVAKQEAEEAGVHKPNYQWGLGSHVNALELLAKHAGSTLIAHDALYTGLSTESTHVLLDDYVAQLTEGWTDGATGVFSTHFRKGALEEKCAIQNLKAGEGVA